MPKVAGWSCDFCGKNHLDPYFKLATYPELIPTDVPSGWIHLHESYDDKRPGLYPDHLSFCSWACVTDFSDQKNKEQKAIVEEKQCYGNEDSERA